MPNTKRTARRGRAMLPGGVTEGLKRGSSSRHKSSSAPYIRQVQKAQR